MPTPSETPLSLNVFARSVVEWRTRKGFSTSKENMLEKLCLVHSEISEAAEDVRSDHWVHFGEEIADAIIRLLDIAGTLEIDLEQLLRWKISVNEGREYKHGKNA